MGFEEDFQSTGMSNKVSLSLSISVDLTPELPSALHMLTFVVGFFPTLHSLFHHLGLFPSPWEDACALYNSSCINTTRWLFIIHNLTTTLRPKQWTASLEPRRTNPPTRRDRTTSPPPLPAVAKADTPTPRQRAAMSIEQAFLCRKAL